MAEVKIYIGASSRDKLSAWESVLISKSARKVLYGVIEDASIASAYLAGITKSLSILRNPCDVTIFTESGYLMLAVNRFIPEWRDKKWENMNEMAFLMKKMDEIGQIHTIIWKFGSIGKSKTISELYSHCFDHILHYQEHKTDL